MNHSRITHQFLKVRLLHALLSPCIILSFKHFKKLFFPFILLALCLAFLFFHLERLGQARFPTLSYSGCSLSLRICLHPSLFLHPSLTASLAWSPYRWRLTWSLSPIRFPDCLLLRRWMAARSARPTQPQLHQAL